MLVLTRKREEKIVIGKDPQIIITILKIQGDKVSIGIEADRGTPIYRSELLQRGNNLEENHSLHNLQIDLSQIEETKAIASNKDS